MKEIKELIGQAIGEASMMWSEIPKGVFESTKASKLVDRTVEAIEQTVLKARIESMEDFKKYLRLNKILDDEQYKMWWPSDVNVIG